MQTTTQHNRTNNSFTFITTLFLFVFTAPSYANDGVEELALLSNADKWQQNRLFEPTAYQRKKETQGNITIYDGLRDTTVKEALDGNFDRIENMMFTRVVITNPAGEPQLDKLGNTLVEDDGC